MPSSYLEARWSAVWRQTIIIMPCAESSLLSSLARATACGRGTASRLPLHPYEAVLPAVRPVPVFLGCPEPSALIDPDRAPVERGHGQPKLPRAKPLAGKVQARLDKPQPEALPRQLRAQAKPYFDRVALAIRLQEA